MGTGIMVLLHVLTVTWILGCVAGDAHAPCCTQKTVGGVSYILVKEGDTSNYNCLTNCMYTKETGGPLYCFAAGDLEVECGDSTVTTEIPGGEDLKLRQLSRSRFPLARCNDGTQATYYVQPGRHSGKVMIWLQGGGACWSEEMCNERCASSHEDSELCTAQNEAEITFR